MPPDSQADSNFNNKVDYFQMLALIIIWKFDPVPPQLSLSYKVSFAAYRTAIDPI